MDMRRHLKQARAKPKRPFSRTAFTVVSALVQEYGLDESFVVRLRAAPSLGGEWLQSIEPRVKTAFEPPPFSLAAAREYALTQAIIAAADTPYLRFARTPEELCLAAALFRGNPGLEPAILARIDFGTLLAREMARAEIARLREEPAATPDPQGRRAFLEALLARLDAFIEAAQ